MYVPPHARARCTRDFLVSSSSIGAFVLSGIVKMVWCIKVREYIPALRLDQDATMKKYPRQEKEAKSGDAEARTKYWLST